MTHTTNQKDPQGRLHGVWEDYLSDGTISCRGHWLHGTPHGVWEYYLSEGTISCRGHYHHGVIHGLSEWYTGGTPTSKEYHLLIR